MRYPRRNDLVVPQVDADGRGRGGREHVDDRTADRYLTPVLHLVFPAIAGGDERGGQLGRVDAARAGLEHDGLHVLDVGAQPLHEWRTYEHGVNGSIQTSEGEVDLETVSLPTERVALDRHIHQANTAVRLTA